jgi:CYTH domain-containing protein/thymidylate kinase
MKIYKVVLTGGPGGGKTTSLACLKKSLEEHGLKVFVVPEAATLLFNSGVDLRGISEEKLLRLQTAMVHLMVALEDSIEDIARSSENDAVILCDRGVFDVGAFMSQRLWNIMLDGLDWSRSELRDRYDAVIHLMSAASGAEEHYTTGNNAARAETPEQARELDERIKNMWVGHPHLRVVEATSDFSSKKRHVMNAIYRVVGIPEPLEIERKYLLADDCDINVPVLSEDSMIEQIYLKDGSRLRIRHFGDLTQFTHTIKSQLEPGKRTEIERKISRAEYADMYSNRDMTRTPIKKLRRCFLWDSQYFELDLFLSPNTNLKLLELELESEDQKVRLPPFLKVVRDVTAEKKYTNKNLALIKAG